MPTPPYTETEQDTLIDGLRADLTTLAGRVTSLETRMTAAEGLITILGGNVTTLQSQVGSLAGDNTTNVANIMDLQTRVGDLEGTSLPTIEGSVSDLQSAVDGLSIAKRQEVDPTQLDKPQIVLRPSTQRVRTGGGKMVNRVVKPR